MPVYKDAKGSWFYKCCVNGKQYLKRGFSTKSEASKAEVIFKAENQNKNTKVKVLKFYDAVDLYLRFKKKEIKPTTYYGYRLKFRKYIIPNFENKVVTKLTWNDFVKFRSKLSNAIIKDKNKILKYLIDLFDYLNLYYEFNIMYAKKLQRFKDYSPGTIKHEVNKPVELELLKKYYKASNHYFRFYLLTTYIFGLRISEVRGLQIDSFDFDNQLLYITKVTTNKVGLNKSIDLIPKSTSSIRKYYYPKIYNDLLLYFIKTYKLKNNDRLFFSKNKKVPLSENSIRTYLNKIEKENNFEHITPHGLRHGIASYLYAKGILWEDIGKYLGHKFNSVTMDTYIDLTKERQKNITSKIIELIVELNLYCED